MKQSDKDNILDVIENEGFDYAFIHYSQFQSVDDARFHELRETYIEARKNLAEFLGLDEQ